MELNGFFEFVSKIGGAVVSSRTNWNCNADMVRIHCDHFHHGMNLRKILYMRQIALIRSIGISHCS